MHRVSLHRVDGSGKGELILMYVRAIRLTSCFGFVYRLKRWNKPSGMTK